MNFEENLKSHQNDYGILKPAKGIFGLKWATFVGKKLLKNDLKSGG